MFPCFQLRNTQQLDLYVNGVSKNIEGRTMVENLLNARRQESSTTQMWPDPADGRISVLGMSSITTWITENFAHRWPTMELKQRHVEILTKLLRRLQNGSNAFVNAFRTCDESWVYHFALEIKRSSLEWRHSDCQKSKGTVFSGLGSCFLNQFFLEEDVPLWSLLFQIAHWKRLHILFTINYSYR